MAAPTKYGDKVKELVWRAYRKLEAKHIEPTARAVQTEVQATLDLEGQESPSYEWVNHEVNVIKARDK